MSYVTEVVWRLGFADVTFRVEPRSDDREHVCVRRLRHLSLYETFTFQTRRGSRRNTGRFPKLAPKAQAFRGVRGYASPGAFLDFNSLKSPFLGFSSHSDRILASSIHLGWSPSTWKVFFYLLKIFRFWKIWPISVKPRKPVWIRACRSNSFPVFSPRTHPLERGEKTGYKVDLRR